MSIRAVHVVPRITNEASGPSYSVVQLCKSLRSNSCEASLAVLGSEMPLKKLEFIREFPIRGLPERLGRSPTMRRWLRQTIETGNVDIVHNHSLWMMPNVYTGWAVHGTNTPLIVSPRGTLSSWALNHSKWVKRAFWYALQYNALRQAACFHATADSEYQEIRNAGFQQPVCIIPNGVDIPARASITELQHRRRRLIFLSRIHPKKGLDILLNAWCAVSSSFQDWELQIIGPDNIGYLREMQELASTLKLDNIVFRGPLFGDEKAHAYREADLYVLPTHSENFGMTVAESLAAGTPAIVSRGAPWSGLKSRGAGWWVEIGVDPLVTCLEEALSYSPDQLSAMGCAGREWMKEEYSWDRVARMMSDTYSWMLQGGTVPECVSR